jgi:hypothetical protein
MMTTGAIVFVGLGSGARRALVISPEIYFQSVFAMLPRWFGIVLLSSDINMCHWRTVRPRARVMPRGFECNPFVFCGRSAKHVQCCASLCLKQGKRVPVYVRLASGV